MSSTTLPQRGVPGTVVALSALDGFARQVLHAAGADAPTCDAATRAMMHATRLGIDSHGVRLLAHYVNVLLAGRVNPRPNLRFDERFASVAVLDADHAHGALASYAAMERAVALAERSGIGAVGIANSSHFGAAGAFALAAAEAGCIGVAMCNTDSFVRLHDGASRFHGTNPIACAVPSDEAGTPWLLDMATSAIPYNRVQLYKSLGLQLPDSTASNAAGEDTTVAEEVEMLAPLGGAFGFKGAGLAGLIEILSAVATGMRLSFELLPMGGPDLATPRSMGALVVALRPDAFVEREVFAAGMRRYLQALRKSPVRSGHTVLAPGDREWAEAARRDTEGAPVDPTTLAAFRRLAGLYGLKAPA